MDSHSGEWEPENGWECQRVGTRKLEFRDVYFFNPFLYTIPVVMFFFALALEPSLPKAEALDSKI